MCIIASMKNVFVLFADGFEEMEAVIPVDLMRRAGLKVCTISMNETLSVVGSRGITIDTDVLFSELNEDYIINNLPDAVFCPGGLNGSKNLSGHPFTKQLLEQMHINNKIIAAICAAPAIVLAPLGYLDDKNFTCYPGMEKLKQYAPNANLSGHKTDRVVVDGSLLTSQGPGTAAELAFTLIEVLIDKETASKVKEEALFN